MRRSDPVSDPPGAQACAPNASPAPWWEWQPARKSPFKASFGMRNEENFQSKTYLFLHYAAIGHAAVPAKSEDLEKSVAGRDSHKNPGVQKETVHMRINTRTLPILAHVLNFKYVQNSLRSFEVPFKY